MAEAAPPPDATYYRELAAIEFAKNNALGNAATGRADTEANYNYNKGQGIKQERLKLTGTRNTANSQGLLESGQLAKRTGEVQTDYATKQGRIAEQRKAAIEKYNTGEKRALEDYNLKHTALTEANAERAKKRIEENPVNEPQAQTAGGGGTNVRYPAAQKAVNQAFPGGIAEQRAWIKANKNVGRRVG